MTEKMGTVIGDKQECFIENDEEKNLWAFQILWDHEIQNKEPELVLI